MTNYIKRFYDKEVWKQVILQTPFVEKYEMYVSNYGNVKKITKSNGQTVNMLQNFTEGYPSVNIGTMLPISEADQVYFTKIRESILNLKNEIVSLNNQLSILTVKDELLEARIAENEALLITITEKYKKTYKKRETKRRRTFGCLVHRIVAIYFLEKPSETHNLVAHLDYDKLNNHHSNLKWMTRAENTEHQKKSPYVIKAKAKVLVSPTRRTNTKLTESQVMILKKRMNEEVPLSKLAKRYKVTETQLLRIKRGINWGKVPAAL
ncbi:HNH endonuclease [Flavobacterium sp.]|uniref:HNH endonuclease n=1 Tax=Flavobacterium sp. TaxID=239 RepID=UPI00286D8A08|nr:HNH endonuclease [Flavobacterium sp.]